MKSIVLATILLVVNIGLFAQHEQFTPIESADFIKYFTVHSPDEGPGTDYFGTLLLRLHLKNRVEPFAVNENDSKQIPLVLKQTGSRFGIKDHNYKFTFSFPSNATWKKGNANLTLFVNNELIKSYNQEINKEDEVWIFFIISSFNTFEMEGFGRVVDFLNKDIMIKRKLISN